MSSLTIPSGLKVFFLFGLIWPLTNPLLAQEKEWKHKKSEDGIEVYYRKSVDSKINELKIETTIDASIISIVALLRDIPAYPDWVMNCKMTEKLSAASRVETCYYSQVDFPWPLADRDFIARNKLVQDPKTKIITSKLFADPEFLPKRKGHVRIPKMEITWILTPVSPNKVLIDYHLKSDPGGKLPSWMVNMAIDKGPISSIKKFKELVQQEKYKLASIPGIENVSEKSPSITSEKD